MQFADIHTHFIPGIDDGAASMEETLEMLRMAYQTGTRQMVATPHMFLDGFEKNDPVRVNDMFAETIAGLKECSLHPEGAFIREMRLVLGAENYGSIEFVDALARGCVVPINGSRYLLVEFSPFLPLNKIEVVLHRVLMAGYLPVIAHTERLIAVQEKTARLENLAAMGCVFQVNGDTFLDSADSRVRKTGQAMASAGFVHVIASDGHRPHRRPPLLNAAFDQLRRKYPIEKVQAWLQDNPNRIIHNQAV